MIITLISPDKLTLSMFVDFYRSLYSEGREVLFTPINHLLSYEKKNIIINDLIKKDSEDVKEKLVFVTLKSDKKEILDTDSMEDRSNKYLKLIPLRLSEVSTYILAFDIYSVTPMVLKDRFRSAEDKSLEIVLNRWNENLKKFGGL
jgi:hypothetical protein